MAYLEKYKNIFGKPREDIHKYRIPYLDIGTVDVLVTFILGLIIYMLGGGKSFTYIMLFLFLIGIITHRLFGVRTRVDKILFSDV